MKSSHTVLASLGRHWALLFLFAELVFFAFAGSGFATLNGVQIVLFYGTSLALLATAETFVVVTGGIDLSVGFVMGFASIVSAKLVAALAASGIAPAPALLLGIAATLAIGLVPGCINGALVAHLKVPPFLATFSTLGIAYGISLLLTGGAAAKDVPALANVVGNGYILYWAAGAGLSLFARPEVPRGTVVVEIIPTMVVITAAVIAVAAFVLARTRFGRHAYAIGGSIDAAETGRDRYPSLGRDRLRVVLVPRVAGGGDLHAGVRHGKGRCRGAVSPRCHRRRRHRRGEPLRRQRQRAADRPGLPHPLGARDGAAHDGAADLRQVHCRGRHPDLRRAHRPALPRARRKGGVGMGALLEVRGVTKRFGGLVAVNRVSLVVNAGEVVALLGDNGAGKSTLIKVVSGVYRPDEGTLLFQGAEVTIGSPMDALALGIETIYQDLALAENLSTPANIFLGRERRRRALGFLPVLDNEYMQAESRKILGKLDIEIPSLAARIRALSGGQRQAVAISRSIYWDAKLLIMDEPTAALGVAEQKKVLDLVLLLKSHGIGIIIISHQLHDVFSVADRLVIMRRGEKVAERMTRDTGADEVVSLIVGAETVNT